MSTRPRVMVVAVAVCLALALAGSAGSVMTSHDTEKHGFGASLLPRDSGPGHGWVRGRITIVKGSPRATISWRLLDLHGLRGRAVEVVVRYGWGDQIGPVVVRLCAACRAGASGRLTFATGRPWFGAERATGSIPRLSIEARTVGGSPTSTLGGAVFMGPTTQYG